MEYDLKKIVKGSAEAICLHSGGIVTYEITTEDNERYLIDIDLSNKHDVGETATFDIHYDKSLVLMRWIRRAIEEQSIIKISK